jgi:putative ABC transport system permease protein
MKMGFYFKLALTNIKKNYRFFIPRILTESGLLGCFFIIFTLAQDERLSKVRGGSYLPMIMSFGSVVISILSFILVLYANSFLMKQRKKEFGLYNVLGMEKKHVGRVLFSESLISSVSAIVLGIILGVVFYKLCSILICRLLEADIILGFYFLRSKNVILSALIFLMMDFITFLFNRISIARMKPVELLKSANVGEREPKIKWASLILGTICLGAGYFIAVTTKDPLAAINIFFLAVLLVIAGTYMLFVSGTIFVLKCLKKNKKYFYTKEHMPAVSGLLFRMKQNAVGLASIAILATGVLIMLSTTVSLYSGCSMALKKSHPEDLYLSTAYYENGEKIMVPDEVIIDIAKNAAKEHDLSIKSIVVQEYGGGIYTFADGKVVSGLMGEFTLDFSKLMEFAIITDDYYEKMCGKKLSLAENEIAYCPVSIGKKTFTDKLVMDDIEFKITETLDSFPVTVTEGSIIKSGGIVVANDEVFEKLIKIQEEKNVNAPDVEHRVAICYEDRKAMFEKGFAMEESIKASLEEYLERDGSCAHEYMINGVWMDKAEMNGMYGTFLFLGIILGFVCLFSTALIIYYKQISEGYEDRVRFQIMKKIGMSETEVKKTIGSQIILVFFLPLIVAGIHVAFASPILIRLMKILLLASESLFFICLAITFAIFGVVYILIYTGTARTYYKIVK